MRFQRVERQREADSLVTLAIAYLPTSWHDHGRVLFGMFGITDKVFLLEDL